MGGTICCTNRPASQLAKSKIPIAGPTMSMYLKAIQRAESLNGGPVTLNEISATLIAQDSFLTPLKNGPLTVIICNLLREDLLWTDDKLIHKFTTKKPDLPNYTTFSESFRKHAPTMTIGSDNTCRPIDKNNVVSYTTLIEILKSKDSALMEGKNAWMFDGEMRMLDGTPIPDGQKVAFNTFPRSGNTFLRRFLDTITGIHTGENMPLSMTTMQ